MVYRAVDVDDYTKIQRQIIKEPLTRSFAVVGGPGTGKTIIALERLQQVISSGILGIISLIIVILSNLPII